MAYFRITDIEQPSCNIFHWEFFRIYIMCLMFCSFGWHVLNLIFALSGFAILCLGTIIQSYYHEYSTFVGISFSSEPILLIVVGSFILIAALAIFTHLSGSNEISCNRLTFYIVLLVIILCELGAGIASCIKYGHLEDTLETGFNKSMTEYSNHKQAWDFLQNEMLCCGIKGPADYQPIFQNGTLPRSCCAKLPPGINVCTQQIALQDGCMPTLLRFLKPKSQILSGVSIGVAIAQLITVSCLYFLEQAVMTVWRRMAD